MLVNSFQSSTKICFSIDSFLHTKPSLKSLLGCCWAAVHEGCGFKGCLHDLPTCWDSLMFRSRNMHISWIGDCKPLLCECVSYLWDFQLVQVSRKWSPNTFIPSSSSWCSNIRPFVPEIPFPPRVFVWIPDLVWSGSVMTGWDVHECGQHSHGTRRFGWLLLQFQVPPTAFEKCTIAASKITGSSNTTNNSRAGCWVWV